MFILDPDFYPSRIPDPKSATKERGGKKFVVIKTYRYRTFYPKICHLSSKKYWFGIRDLGSGKNLFRIPDPGSGVKRHRIPHLGSGSATLDYLNKMECFQICKTPHHECLVISFDSHADSTPDFLRYFWCKKNNKNMYF